MSRRRFRLVVDPVACDGAGVCAELLPERIGLDPWGYPIIEPGELPDPVLDHAQRAVNSCPRLALTLVRIRPSTGDTQSTAAAPDRGHGLPGRRVDARRAITR